MFLRDDSPARSPRIAIRYPVELGHQLGRPDVRRGVAVTLQAHTHIERLHLLDLDHLVDSAVAAHAAYARGDVRLVIKINVVSIL